MDFSFRRPPAPPGPALPAELRAYWEALRGSDAFPARDRVDPRGIAGILDQSFLVERIAPGIARFRLAGMRLVDLMGMDLRGMPMSCMFGATDRDRFSRALEEVFATPSILDARLEAERGYARPALSARMLLLPLGDRYGQPTLALGCLALGTEALGGAPRRFAIAGLMRETVSAGGDTRPMPFPEMSRPAPVPTPEPAGFAEPATAWQPAATAGRPHLRLVHDADRPASRD